MGGNLNLMEKKHINELYSCEDRRVEKSADFLYDNKKGLSEFI